MSIGNWAERIYDISEFLVKFTDLKFNATREAKVTYHDPCHLRKRQRIYEEPRQILKSMPSIDFIEMEEADSCCGGGGLFSFKYYDISKVPEFPLPLLISTLPFHPLWEEHSFLQSQG